MEVVALLALICVLSVVGRTVGRVEGEEAGQQSLTVKGIWILS